MPTAYAEHTFILHFILLYIMSIFDQFIKGELLVLRNALESYTPKGKDEEYKDMCLGSIKDELKTRYSCS